MISESYINIDDILLLIKRVDVSFSDIIDAFRGHLAAIKTRSSKLLFLSDKGSRIKFDVSSSHVKNFEVDIDADLHNLIILKRQRSDLLSVQRCYTFSRHSSYANFCMVIRDTDAVIGNNVYSEFVYLCRAENQPFREDERKKSSAQPEHWIERHNSELNDRLAILHLLLKWKLSSLSFLPAEMIELAWERARTGGDSPIPWQIAASGGAPLGSNIGTVSLSLDLRKSTFMMRQAQDRSRYAHWLEALAEIARDFTLRHGGIYDKFTGDGAIAHFIYDVGEVGRASRIRAICSAFKCAQDLILACKMHLANIEPEFDYLSGESGPAVGLAFGPAAWSLDRDGRPVVVGAGLVNACRLCGGPSGSIRATISIKHVLERRYRSVRFEHQHIKDHKDFPSNEDPICAQLLNGVTAKSGRLTEIRARVDSIWSEIEARHANSAALAHPSS